MIKRLAQRCLYYRRVVTVIQCLKIKADAWELSKKEGMTTLKCLQELKDKKELTPHENPEKRRIMKEDDLIDLFPLPRYFQVHFELIHDVQGKLNHLNHDMQNQLDQLKRTLAAVEGKLDRFIVLLDEAANAAEKTLAA